MAKDTIKLSSLKLNERNPRKISEGALEKLCKSIKRDPKFMEMRPIIVDKDNVIVGGNQRYKALVKLGRKEIPKTWVYTAESLTPAQRKRFVLVDNAPDGMAGYWDFDILQEDYKLLDLENLGFSFPEEIDYEKEWEGMPEFDHPEQNAYKTVNVNFADKKAYDHFQKLIGQSLTNKTKSIWFPKRDLDQQNREYEIVTENKK